MTNLGQNMLGTSTSTHVNKRPMTLWLRRPSLIFTQQSAHHCPAGDTHLTEPVSWSGGRTTDLFIANSEGKSHPNKSEWYDVRQTRREQTQNYTAGQVGANPISTLMEVSQMKPHLGATQNIVSTKTTKSDFYIHLHKTSCVQLPGMIWEVTLSTNLCTSCSSLT